jgi:2-dehydro-3-deoxygluconokinase
MEMSERCVAIGECMLELSGNTGDYQLGFGGDTLNAAIYMARQGIPVGYLTALGDDPYSENMLDAWRAEGVSTSLVRRLPGRLPGFYIIETDEEGDRSFHYWRDSSPARELFDGPEGRDVLEQLLGFECLYLSGITLSLYTKDTLDMLLNFFHRYHDRGGSLVFDSNYRPGNWPSAESASTTFDRFLPFVKMALPSLEDEQLLHSGATADTVMERYRSFGVQEVVVKNGPGGCLAWADEDCAEVYRHTFIPVEPLDTTAAGDSFNGSYLTARMSGVSVVAALKIAHGVASLVVQHRGAIIPKG